MKTLIKQFNFSRHWRSKIAPHLNNKLIVQALTIGMKLEDKNYEQGDPPWEYGRGPLNGQRAIPGKLSWYQPWGRCHAIAPFSWAIGITIYPKLKWGFITSDAHTVAIGFQNDWECPSIVMDILLFRKKTAQASLEFAKGQGWSFCENMGDYPATYLRDTESSPDLVEFVLKEGGVRDCMNQRFQQLMP